MMKRRILLAFVALVAGVAGMWADTTLLTEAEGWTKITSISQDDIDNNYYVFVAANQDLMLHSALATNSKQKKNDATTVLYYQTSVQPYRDLSTVFTIEPNGSLFAMRNLQYNTYQLQGSGTETYWRTNDVASSSASSAKEYSAISFAYTEGAWTITTTRKSRPLGIFDDVSGEPADGTEVGANAPANAQKFQIYAISKTDFDKLRATIATDATALPAGGAVEAGKWYYYEAESVGTYSVTCSVPLAQVVYTTDGSILMADAGNVATTLAETLELEAGRIYFCAKADATISFEAGQTINPLDPADGWQPITSLSQADIADHYYVFQANGQSLMLGAAHTSSGQNKNGANYVLFYQAPAEPFRDQAKVFTLEALGEAYAMRNLQHATHLFQCSSNANYWRTNDIAATSASNAPDWCPVDFAYADGAWTITTKRNSRPLGLFENKAGTPEIGAEVGANDADKAQRFQIYAISHADFAKLSATIATAAEPLPAGGAMEAGKWYAFDVPAEGSYMVKTDNPSEVLFTTDGSILARDDAQVTATLQASMELAAGTIYVKALKATTLAFAAEAFVAAPSIANGKYLQTLDGLTVAFATPANTNPFVVLGDAKATLTNGTDATQLAMSVSGTTVSFDKAELKPASNYTLTIPAGAVGYSETKANPEPVAIQFFTPALFDGEFYLFSEEHQGFLSRGANWGTRAILDNYGYPVEVVTSDANVSHIKFLDNNLYLGSDGYTDKAADYSTIDWAVELTDKGYLLKSANGSYLVKSENEYFRVDGTEGTPFVLKTIAEQKAFTAAIQDANLRKVAEAMGIAYTDKAAFEQYLADTYTAVDQTMRIASPTDGSTTAWAYTELSGTTYNVGTYGGEIYQSAGSVKQTIKVAVPGLYKLSVAGFFRDGSLENCYALGQKGYVLSNATVSVNGTYVAALPDWYSVCTSATVPNNVTEAKTLMDAGKCTTDVYAFVGDDLTLNVELKVPGRIALGWVIFGNWKLTFIGDESNIFLAHKEEMGQRWTGFRTISAQATEHDAFDQYLNEAIASLPAIMTEDELAAKDAEVWGELCNFLASHTTPTGQFDITSVITNPNFDKNAAGWDTQNTLGWDAGVAEDFGHTDSKISQTLKNMPAGTYTMKVQGFYRSDAYRVANYNYEQGKEVNTARMFFGTMSQTIKSINDDARMQPARPSSDVNGANRRSIPNTLNGTAAAFGTGQYWNVMTATLGTASDVTFGLRHSSGNADCWMPFDNFRLYYGANVVDLTLSELEETYPLTEDTRANVTVERALKAGAYNPVCLPFDLDATAFQSAWTLAGIEADGGQLVGTLIPVKQLKAGQCYWVKVAADTPQIKADNVLVRAFQPDSIPVLWEGGALKGSYDGYMANIILDKSLSGPVSFKEIDFNDVRATVNLENWQARRFLAEVTYTADSETQIAAYNVPAPARRDEPHEVFLPVPASKSKLTVTYALDPQFTGATTLTAAAGTTLVELLNLEPQQTYYYKVEDATRVITQGQVKTEGYLRQIKVPTVSNVRDMGGWLTAGGNRVRYGLVYRGGELNGDHLMYNGTALSEADRKELRRLGIAAELDLREDNDDSVKDVDAAGKSTALGNGAQYLYLNLNMWNAQALQLYSAKFKSAFDFIISNLRADRNVYFHCIWGADRTGAIGFLLNGLLGATEDQLYKDYELTSYSLAGSRVKGTLDGDGEKLPYIKSLEGENLQMKFFNYLSKVAGIAEADLVWLVQLLGGDTDNLPTSIHAAPAEGSTRQQPVIYDLSGRRVKSATRRGVYIINGRRVAVK